MVGGGEALRVDLVVVVEEDLLGQDVPGDVGVQVRVLLKEVGEDVPVDDRVEVHQLLGHAHVRPDHDHVRPLLEDGVPHLQVLDLGECVPDRLLGRLVEERLIVWAKELHPELQQERERGQRSDDG